MFNPIGTRVGELEVPNDLDTLLETLKEFTMSDVLIYVMLISGVLIFIGGVTSIFAVVSNRNRKSVKALKEANGRLLELREEYIICQEKNKRLNLTRKKPRKSQRV